MKITLSKLHQIEKQANKKVKNITTNLSSLIPNDLTEFAKEISIRSGKTYKQFELYDYQIKCSDDIDSVSISLLVKTRQTGISQLILLKFIHWTSKQKGFVGLVFSKTQQDSFALAKRCREMILSHKYLKLETDSLAELSLAGGGKILFRSPGSQSKSEESGGTGGRGLDSVSAIFFDEAAFLTNFEMLWSSAMPSTEMLGNDFKVIIVSTPNTKTDFYFNLLISNNSFDVINKINEIRNKIESPYYSFTADNGWKKIIIHWRCHPIYSKNDSYLEDLHTKKQIPWKSIKREYDLSFEDSDLTIFPTELIVKGAVGSFEDTPVFSAEYFGGLDTNTVGNDYLAFVIIKYHNKKLNVVNIFKARKQSMQKNLVEIFKLLELYGIRKIGIETNGGGELYYQAISRKYNRVNCVRLTTTEESKIIAVDRLTHLIESGVLIYPYCDLSDELAIIQRVGNKISAPKGKHDDTVMATNFAIEVTPISIGVDDIFGDVSIKYVTNFA